MSVQPPLAVAAPFGGPPYVNEEHPAMPEVASVPRQLIVTGWLYQPLWSGPRENFAVTPVGGVASIFNGLVVIVVVAPEPFVAEQVSLVPVVGPGIVIAATQLDEVASFETVQWRITLSPFVLPRYQPLLPAIPVIE
jgi:hypothetical protein